MEEKRLENYIEGRSFLNRYVERVISGFPVTIAWAGDSTIRGTGPTDPFAPSGMIEKLGKAWNLQLVGLNFGVGSATMVLWNSTYLPSHLAYFSSFNRSPPDMYLISYGINDFGQPYSMNVFEDNLRQGLSTLRSSWALASTSVVVCTPNSFGTAGLADNWFNAAIPILRRAAADFQCVFMNVYEWMRTSTVQWAPPDYVHPDNIGYVMLSGVYADLLSVPAYNNSRAPIGGVLNLQNGWKNLGAGYGSAAIFKDLSGYANIEGVIDNGSTPIDGGVVFTVSNEFRPQNTVMLRAGGNLWNNRLLIQPDGNAIGYGLSKDFTSLDSLRWRIY